MRNLVEDQEHEFQFNTQYRQFVEHQLKSIGRYDVLRDALASLGERRTLWQRPNETERQAVERIALQNLMDARQRVNFSLEKDDVIFVPKSGIAEFGYVSRQIASGLSRMTFGAALGK